MPKPAPVYELQYVLRPEQDRTYVPFQDSASHPFEPDPQGVPRVNVWWLAEASLASYGDSPQAIPTYRGAGLEAHFISAFGTDCYVAYDDRSLLVTFRGTEGDRFEDVFTDLKFAQVHWIEGKVHAGFAAAVNVIWPALEPCLKDLSAGRSVWFTGHSLGAALATLAAARYPGTRGVCTFGSPRVGDERFAASFTSRFLGRHLRYVNNRDVVTQVPPALFLPLRYQHVDPRRWIDGDGNVSFQTPPMPHYFAEVFGSPEVFVDLMHLLRLHPASSAPPPVLDHMPKAYAIWAWNDYELHG